jgi:hypothetical protein
MSTLGKFAPLAGRPRPQAVIWIYLSWRDPRVRGQIKANLALMEAPNSTYECKYPCQSTGKAVAGGCCDGVWQPYVAFTNVRLLPAVRGGGRAAVGWARREAE